MLRTEKSQQLDSEFKVKADRGEYDVVFDSVSSIDEQVEAKDRVFIIDSNVYSLYPNLQRKMAGEKHMIIEASEENKSLDFVANILLPWLLESGVSRSSRVVVIGGGIVQDVASFACSVFMRGVSWVLFPTTLLAQADSCIGSKTSINFDKAKNLLGTFYPARRVIIDHRFLESLPDEDFLSGVGEIVKVCLLDGEESCEWLARNMKQLMTREDEVVREAIYRALMIKKGYIEQDEYDQGVRNELNYGHCYGHALEAASNYQISHGLGVMYGMEAANLLSRKMGLIGESEYRGMWDLIASYFIQQEVVKEISFDDLLPYLKKDKKAESGKLTFIVSRGVGSMFKQASVNVKLAEQAWESCRGSL